MFVSPELPIGYPRFYDRAQGAALELYKSEWTAAIKRYRNHPAIFDWCMGNEQWEGMPRVGPDLYRIAKELDTTRPVIDSDGISSWGFFDGTRDRPTLDFYTVMFDILTTPFDNPDKFKTGKPLKPIITHEEGNFVHFPQLDDDRAVLARRSNPSGLPIAGTASSARDFSARRRSGRRRPSGSTCSATRRISRPCARTRAYRDMIGGSCNRGTAGPMACSTCIGGRSR